MNKYTFGITAERDGKWKNFAYRDQNVKWASSTIGDLRLQGYRQLTCEIIDPYGEVVAYYDGVWDQNYFNLLEAEDRGVSPESVLTEQLKAEVKKLRGALENIAGIKTWAVPDGRQTDNVVWYVTGIAENALKNEEA